MSENHASVSTFNLQVDLTALEGNTVDELGRILRYWAGNLKHYDVDSETSESLYDSAFNSVGTWKIS